MRILVFSTDDHLYPAGGAEQAFGNIAERLPHITFDLVCARLRKTASKYEQVGNVRIHRIGFGIPKVDGILLALFGHRIAMRLLKKNKYNLVWSIMASYGAFSAVRVKQKTKLPFLLTLQEGDSFEHIYKKVRWVKRSFHTIFASADGVQAISNYLLTWGKEMGYRGERGLVIPNGVNVEKFTQVFDKKLLKEKRESFGFPPDAKILVTTSRLELKNGVGDVIEALQELPPEVCFVVCGSGSLEEVLQARVLKLGLGHRVNFLGFVDPDELPLILHASDIFIRPSHTEGLGNAFLEAMAARKITIGTRAGGIPDFLTHGETGYMVEIGSPTSISETILKVMQLDDRARDEILDHAERMVRAKYDWNLIAQEMEGFFKTLVS